MDLSKLVTKEMKDEELLIKAKLNKEYELKQDYFDSETNATIEKDGSTYHTNKDTLTKLYVEYKLAVLNNDTFITVFDITNTPKDVDISLLPAIMQDIRDLSNNNLVKIKNKIKQVRSASTIENVESIIW